MERAIQLLKNLENTESKLVGLNDTIELLGSAFDKKGADLTYNVLQTISFSLNDIINELDGHIDRYSNMFEYESINSAQDRTPSAPNK